VFAGWSDGMQTNSTTVVMNAPKNMTVLWSTQYFVNVTSRYANTTGTGWYNRNSTANVSLNESSVKTGNESRLAFLEWSNDNANTSMQIVVDRPMALNAQFAQQYLVRLVVEDAYGTAINGVAYYNISSRRTSNSSVFVFSGKRYNVEYIYYKNTVITTDYALDVSSPETVSIKAPVYDVVVSARSMFGTPVNATVNATFKNGTVVLLNTGTDGVLMLHDVPYGYVMGDAKYFGLTEDISLSEGADASLTFVTPSLVIAILVGIAIIVLVSRISIHYRDHFMKRS
jgi:hypothetical protein